MQRVSKPIRFFVCAIASLMFFAIFLSSGGAEIKKVFAAQTTLTVFNVSDYIDADICYDFEQYEKSLGKDVRVDYVEYATPEELYNELTRDPNCCDLMCPSEYMIMKMRDENLLKAFPVPENYKDNVSPYIENKFNELGFNINDGGVAKTYSCGYMWGTMGFLYNADEISAEELNNWDKILTNEKCNGKVTIKDSIRDTYMMSVGAVHKEELLQLDKSLSNYNDQLTEIFNRTDDETVSKVESYLQNLRLRLHSFEVDSGKNDIITGKINVNFAWSGDAACTITENEDYNLCYVVPEEGSNVWFDGWVMPKNANEELACEFLDFMSSQSSAVRNMEAVGYTSVLSGKVGQEFSIKRYVKDDNWNTVYDSNGNRVVDEESTSEYDSMFDWLIEYYELETDDEEEELNEVNLSYFFEGNPNSREYVVYTDEENKSLFAQYADWDTIQRCAVMDNFDTETLTRINAMWNRVKLVTFSWTEIIVITVGIVLIISGCILIKYRDRIFNKKIPTDKCRKNKKYKVIKTEEI